MKDLGICSFRVRVWLVVLATLFSLSHLQSLAASTSPTRSSGLHISVTPSSMSFGTVAVGSTSTQSARLTNASTSALTVSRISVPKGFATSGLTTGMHIPAGQSVALSIRFAPTATGSVSGSVFITVFAGKNSWRNSTTASVLVSGTGTAVSAAALTINPSSLSFGNVQVGTSQTQNAVVLNSGGSSASISTVTVSGTGFTASGLNVPLTLAAGQSASFTVSFSPQATGTISGSVTLSSTASVPPIALSGSGTSAGQLTASPGSLSFGNVVIGSTGTQSASLTASSANVTVSGASSTNGEFSISGITLPVTIAAGKSVPFNVVFAPTASGTATANLTFSTSAPTSPIVGLSGSGAAPPQHSVTLSWSPDAGTVSGYNVYRGTSSGGPYTEIDALDPSTAYVDGSVQAGSTYYYVVTAVGSTGVESAYSNQVIAVIPGP